MLSGMKNLPRRVASFGVFLVFVLPFLVILYLLISIETQANELDQEFQRLVAALEVFADPPQANKVAAVASPP